MEIAALVALLTPCLPILMKFGEKAVEGAGEKLGGQVLEGTQKKAKAVWNLLEPSAHQDLKDAAAKVAAKPESQAWVSVFKEELTTLLEQNSALMEKITALLGDSDDTSGRIHQTAEVNEGVMVASAENSKVIGSITVETGNVSF